LAPLAVRIGVTEKGPNSIRDGSSFDRATRKPHCKQPDDQRRWTAKRKQSFDGEIRRKEEKLRWKTHEKTEKILHNGAKTLAKIQEPVSNEKKKGPHKRMKARKVNSREKKPKAR